MPSSQNIFILFCILLTGLMGGFYFGYYGLVHTGLERLPDIEYLQALQSLQMTFKHPLFLLPWTGLVCLLPLSTWQVYDPEFKTCYYYMLAASLVYITGVFSMTWLILFSFNPLTTWNGSAAGIYDPYHLRLICESGWGSLQWAPPLFALISFILCSLALYYHRS